jgi:hypothetical protein
MSKVKDRKSFPFSSSGNYRIRVLGSLDKRWAEKLGGLRIAPCSLKNSEGPVTELVGKVRDQAELSGVLNTIYEFHLTLLAVEVLEGGK